MTNSTIEAACAKAEEAFEAAVKVLREDLSQYDATSRFCVQFEADGRVHENSIRIEYAVQADSYSSKNESPKLINAYHEYVRRNDWSKANETKYITSDVKDVEDIKDETGEATNETI